MVLFFNHLTSYCPAQIAESVNDSTNSSLVMGSIPTVSSRKIYFVACCGLVEPEWACLWEGSCVSGRPTFAGAEWCGKCLAGSQVYGKSDARRSHSRYPILREAGWLATVVGLAHIGVVGTGDLAGGL